METYMNDLIHSFPDGPEQKGNTSGLTKREYFAGLAMQGLLSAIYSSKEMLNDFTYDGATRTHSAGRDAVSRNAVSYADALIKELNK